MFTRGAALFIPRSNAVDYPWFSRKDDVQIARVRRRFYVGFYNTHVVLRWKSPLGLPHVKIMTEYDVGFSLKCYLSITNGKCIMIKTITIRAVEEW